MENPISRNSIGSIFMSCGLCTRSNISRPAAWARRVEAAIRFLEGGGERVIIAHLNELMPALRGEAGTLIVADDE